MRPESHRVEPGNEKEAPPANAPKKKFLADLDSLSVEYSENYRPLNLLNFVDQSTYHDDKMTINFQLKNDIYKLSLVVPPELNLIDAFKGSIEVSKISDLRAKFELDFSNQETRQSPPYSAVLSLVDSVRERHRPIEL